MAQYVPFVHNSLVNSIHLANLLWSRIALRSSLKRGLRFVATDNGLLVLFVRWLHDVLPRKQDWVQKKTGRIRGAKPPQTCFWILAMHVKEFNAISLPFFVYEKDLRYIQWKVFFYTLRRKATQLNGLWLHQTRSFCGHFYSVICLWWCRHSQNKKVTGGREVRLKPQYLSVIRQGSRGRQCILSLCSVHWRCDWARWLISMTRRSFRDISKLVFIP